MKTVLFILSLLISVDGICQQQQQKRNINFKVTGDTIRLTFNDQYYLIEDTCGYLFRYSQFDAEKHILTGRFKDVSKQNPSLILAEGNYTSEGLKDGLFTARYPNGNLRSKGAYKLNNYDGNWELFYSDGKPRFTFRADSGKIFVINMWNTKGEKIVDNGNGTYEGPTETLKWEGKIYNGLPYGLWTATDVLNKQTLLREMFNKGEFVSGKSPMGNYTDRSRIIFVMPSLFPYLEGEHLFNSPQPCNATGSSLTNIKSAEYGMSTTNFNNRVNELMDLDLRGIDFKSYQVNQLAFDCQIKTTGSIGEVRCSTMFDETVIRKIETMLRKFPAFKPATVNGKPVTQMFKFTILVNPDVISYNYQIMPMTEYYKKN